MTTEHCSNYPRGGRTVTVVAVLISLATATTAYSVDLAGDDLAGDYCSTMRGGCCVGRMDNCSVPILGTLCYCDTFCYHATRDDCCPDYWTTCVTHEPSNFQRCYHDGRYYKHGETVNVNCNECRCGIENGKSKMICEKNECLTDPLLLEMIKFRGSEYGWYANNYSEFWGKKFDEALNSRLGALDYSTKEILLALPLQSIKKKGVSPPPSYDPRKIRGINISQPIDQGWCGASWVISTVQVTTDRFNIMSKGAINDVLSPQHLLSCYSENKWDDGCKGGDVTEAWNWIRNYGIIKEKCYPWEGHKTECAVRNANTDREALCPSNKGKWFWAKTKLRKVMPAYRLARGESIMNDILYAGPVQAIMKVSKDFFMYKSGVYRCSDLSSRSKYGYHSVRIIGWGEEYQNQKKVKYWIVSNSWGRGWGENGYFRILKDTNECDIEKTVIAALAMIDNDDQPYQEGLNLV